MFGYSASKIILSILYDKKLIPDHKSRNIVSDKKIAYVYPQYFRVFYWIYLATLIITIIAGMFITILSLLEPSILKQAFFCQESCIIQNNSSWSYIFAFIAMIGSISVFGFLYMLMYLLLPKKLRDFLDVLEYALTITALKGDRGSNKAKQREFEIISTIDPKKLRRSQIPLLKFLVTLAIVSVISYMVAFFDYIRITPDGVYVRTIIPFHEQFIAFKPSVLLVMDRENYRSKSGSKSTLKMVIIYQDKEYILKNRNRNLSISQVNQIIEWAKENNVQIVDQQNNY